MKSYVSDCCGLHTCQPKKTAIFKDQGVDRDSVKSYVSDCCGLHTCQPRVVNFKIPE